MKPSDSQTTFTTNQWRGLNRRRPTGTLSIPPIKVYKPAQTLLDLGLTGTSCTTTVEPAALLLGAVRYRQGAYGTVRLVNLGDREMAVKMTKITGEEMDHMARKEYQILNRLSHPNIVKVHKFEINPDTLTSHLYMDYVRRGTLQDLINKKLKLTETDIKSLFKQLIRALEYLAGRNLVHRDINPSNLLLSESQLIVIDFQTACSPEKCQGAVGTEGFQAPEMWSEDLYDCKADIWAAGKVLKVLIQDCCQTEVSTNCTDVIFRCLETDVVRRPTASDLLRHIWLN